MSMTLSEFYEVTVSAITAQFPDYLISGVAKVHNLHKQFYSVSLYTIDPSILPFTIDKAREIFEDIVLSDFELHDIQIVKFHSILIDTPQAWRVQLLFINPSSDDHGSSSSD